MPFTNQQSYNYSSEPQTIEGGYEQNKAPRMYRNIMFDKRVVRGSTYSAQIAVNDENVTPVQRKSKKRRPRQKRSEQVGGAPGLSGEALPPVDGRRHIDVQTDNYLEELTDKMPESTSSTQTDILMDLPDLPRFIPTKKGVDAETQIMPDDLFDFDIEVVPLLEVLVGKTLEHSMMEVLEEEEMEAIRAHQREFEHERNLELAAVKRLEAEAIRRSEEKAKRIEEERKRKAREQEVNDKINARKFAKTYLQNLHGNVFGNLMEAGHFYDPLEREVSEVFIPSLLESVAAINNTATVARSLAKMLIRKAQAKKLAGRKEVAEAYQRKKEEELERIKAEEEAKRKAEEEAKAAEEAGEGGEDDEGDL